MYRLKKVIDHPRFSTTSSSSRLYIDRTNRGVLIGRTPSNMANDTDDRELLGKVIESSHGHNMLDFGVWLDTRFPHIVGVFGTRGSGKSFSLGVLIENFLEQDDKATVVFDVQNQFWTLGFAPDPSLEEDREHVASLSAWGLESRHASNVIQWSPCRADPLFPEARVFRLAPDQLGADDWLRILELERYSPMGQALIELLRTGPFSDAGELARNLAAGAIRDYATATLDGLRWRLDSLYEIELIGDSGISIDELLVGGRTSILLLRNLSDDLRALVTGVIARLLESKMSAYHQSIRTARREGRDVASSTYPSRVCIVLDEAHVLAPNSEKTCANAPLVDYAKRGRDAGLSMLFATQQPSAVDTRLISQTDLTITHTLSFDADIQAAISRMPSDASHRYAMGATQADIPLGSTIRSLGPGESMIADASSSRVFMQMTRPRMTAHGGNTPL